MNKPDHFLWGVSTAGHQTDGGDAAADTTFLEHVEPTVFKEPAGDACRSWERWEDDLNCVAEMGLNAYRFSVEWCRIEQEEGVIDQAALDHYDRLMDGCLARGIQPVLTLCHFVLIGLPNGVVGSRPTLSTSLRRMCGALWSSPAAAPLRW